MKHRLAPFLSLLFISLACSNLNKTGTTPASYSPSDSLLQATKINDIPRFYDSVYPQDDPSAYFEELSGLVKRLIITLHYKTYYADGDQRLTPQMLKFQRIEKLTRKSHSFDYSKIGTAIPVRYNSSGQLLLTCKHIVAVKDTILSFWNEPGIPKKTYLKSVTVLERIEYFIFNDREILNFTVLSMSDKSDLAFIFMKYSHPRDIVRAQRFPYKLGNSKDLKWGSQTFTFGYPLNNLMMTNGIVSNPNSDEQGSFFTNSNYNRGYSGGLVVALRGGLPNIEWVGVASSVSSENEFVLVPNARIKADFEEGQVYSDTLFLEKKSSINYGISKAVTTDEMIQFFDESKNILWENGFNIESFYKSGN